MHIDLNSIVEPQLWRADGVFSNLSFNYIKGTEEEYCLKSQLAFMKFILSILRQVISLFKE